MFSTRLLTLPCWFACAAGVKTSDIKTLEEIQYPRSKQLIWRCTQGGSKAIQTPCSIHGGPACSEPLCERPFRFLRERPASKQLLATSCRCGRTRASRRRPEGGKRGQRSLVKATVVGLYWISKVFRPEFDARGAQARAPDRDRAVPGLHSAVFGSRPP
jgi:hypothetical protein